MYITYCKENEFKPFGKSSHFKILRACMAFNRTNLHGLDDIAAEGVEAFQTLHDLFVDLRKDILICENTHKELILHFSVVFT